MWLITLIPVLAVLNRLRGSDVPFTSKGVTSFAAGLVTCCILWLHGGSLLSTWAHGAAVFLGLWIWAAPGWGRYFLSFQRNTAQQPGTREKEDRIADWFAGLLEPDPRNDAEWRRFGTAGMAARGAVYSVPMGVFLTFAGWPEINWLALLFGPLMAAQGFIYGAFRYADGLNGNQRVEWAEVATGAWQGLLLAGVLSVG